MALRRRPAKGLLAGLWEYPNALEEEGNPLADWGFDGTETSFDGTGVHIFTHVEWHMTAQRAALTVDTLPPGWVWADKGALRTQYAVPSAFAPFQNLVEEELS